MRCPSINSRMNKVVVGISIKASLLLMRLLGLRGGEHEEDDCPRTYELLQFDPFISWME